MSTDKGGSDLDVFNDLKPQTPDGTPILETKKTLMGLQVPEGAVPPTLPPVPGSSPHSSSRSIPPPPPSQRPRRSSVNLPVPAGLANSGLGNPGLGNPGLGNPGLGNPGLGNPGLGNPALGSPGLGKSGLANIGALSRKPDDEDRADDTTPGVPPVIPSAASREGFGLDSWAMTQPPGVSGRISIPPSPQISALPDKLASVAAPAAAGAANGDVGWDDDDDKTQVYDKDTQAAAQSLLQPALPGLPGRPPPPMSRPPGAILPPGVLPPGAAFAPRTTIPPSPQDAFYPLPVAPAPSQKLPRVFMFLSAVLIGALVFVLLPKKGGLTVTVAGGPGNKELVAVEVIVDNKVRCRASPCELSSLKQGTHYVEVRAAGYQATAKSAVAITGGQTQVHNVQLIRAGTGIKVFGEGSGLTLLVDGKEFGPLPQELREMEPGEHVVQVAGGSRYEVFTQRIIVDPDRMTPIGPIRLKVTKGLATIRAGRGAEEAEVTLKVGDSRRVLPALPVRLEVETDRPHVLIAKRKGYSTFEEPITFDDGQAEKTIEILLTERPAEDQRRRSPVPGAPGEGAAAEPAAAEPAPPASHAMLQLTSTPPSNVLLDGKPLGTTPLRDVSVEPGTHRVIFIYGAERKPKTIEVAPGSAQIVSVSF